MLKRLLPFLTIVFLVSCNAINNVARSTPAEAFSSHDMTNAPDIYGGTLGYLGLNEDVTLARLPEKSDHRRALRGVDHARYPLKDHNASEHQNMFPETKKRIGHGTPFLDPGAGVARAFDSLAIFISIVDFPFTLAVDTLLLPYTILVDAVQLLNTPPDDQDETTRHQNKEERKGSSNGS